MNIMKQFGNQNREPVKEVIRLPSPGDSRCLLIPKSGRSLAAPGMPPMMQLPPEINTNFRSRVLLVRWRIKEALEHLMGVRSVWGWPENLVINHGREERWQPFTSPHLDDALSGKWYKRTVEHLRRTRGLDAKMVGTDGLLVLVNPLIIYGDKTGKDAYQRYSMEPWMVTSALLRRFIRYQPWAWRHIGFIPDLELKSKATKGRQRVKDQGISTANYHFCFKAMLEGFREVTTEGFITYVRLGKLVRKVRMVCPIMMVLNDGKSGDTLVCRYLSYRTGTGAISRRCLTSFEDCDDPLHECEWRDGLKIQELLKACEQTGGDNADVRADAHSQLKQMSIHPVNNAFDTEGVSFGDNDMGISYATPGDFMHMFDSGVIKYVVKCTLDSIGDQKKAALDLLVDDLFCNHRSSLKSEYPRNNFAKGFTNLTLITSNEWAGCLFTLALLCSTDAGQEILSKSKRFQKENIADDVVHSVVGQVTNREEEAKKISAKSKQLDDNATRQVFSSSESEGEEQREPPAAGASRQKKRKAKSKRLNEEHEEYQSVLRKCSVLDFLNLAETLLCFRSLYKSEEAIKDWFTWDNQSQSWDSELTGKKWELDKSIRRMLALVKLYMPRETGNGWKIQKFHDALHAFRDFEEFGLAQNYDCGTNESGLKSWAKDLSATAQMRGAPSFISQLSDRQHEAECIADALSANGYSRFAVPRSPEQVLRDNYAARDRKLDKCMGTRVKIYSRRSLPPKWLGDEKRRKGHLDVHPSVHRSFQKMILMQREHMEDAKNPAPDSYVEPQMDLLNGRLEPFWCCYSECSVYLPDEGKRRTLRAHPNYHNEGSYYDWVYAHFHGESSERSRFPSKIVTFVKDKVGTDQEAIYALVQSCTEEDKRFRRNDSVIFYHWFLEYENAETKGRGNGPTPRGQGTYLRAVLRLVPIESLSAGCYAFEERKVHFSEGHLHLQEVAAGKTTTEEEKRHKRCFRHVIVVGHPVHWASKFWNGSGEEDAIAVLDQEEEDEYLAIL
jgi:hypothetical protein